MIQRLKKYGRNLEMLKKNNDLEIKKKLWKKLIKQIV